MDKLPDMLLYQLLHNLLGQSPASCCIRFYAPC